MSNAIPARRTPPVVSALLVLVALACASPPPVLDASPGLEVAIDGAYDDWGGRFTRLEPHRSVGLAATQDGESLYLCLVSRDLGVQTLLRQAGFTVWIDPEGGQRARIGLRVAPVRANGGDEGEPPPPAPGDPLVPRIEIVRDGSEYGYQLAETGPERRVEASTAQSGDVVVYEFRIATGTSLTGRSDGGAVVPAGRPLGLGIATEPLELGPRPAGAPRAPEIDPLRVWVVASPDGAASGT